MWIRRNYNGEKHLPHWMRTQEWEFCICIGIRRRKTPKKTDNIFSVISAIHDCEKTTIAHRPNIYVDWLQPNSFSLASSFLFICHFIVCNQSVYLTACVLFGLEFIHALLGPQWFLFIQRLLEWLVFTTTVAAHVAFVANAAIVTAWFLDFNAYSSECRNRDQLLFMRVWQEFTS